MDFGSNISKSYQLAEYVDRIGPWAFQSFSKNKWHQVSEDDIIEGVLVSAPKSEKLKLVSLFGLPPVMRVWRNKVLIQDEWLHANNVWIAQHLFMQKNPERFVAQALQISQKQEAMI